MQSNTIKTIIYAAATSLIVMCIGYKLYPPKTIYVERDTANAEKVLFAKNERLLQELSKTTELGHFITAAEHATGAVVFVQVIKSDQKKENYSAGNGSGVIMSDEGHIISNYHVIRDAEDILVSLEDNRTFAAEVLGFDEDTDLALLKIEASGLDFLEITDSDDLRVGEWVLAVGNPFNLESTVTAGIVSAKGRNINLFDKTKIEAFIQTDAAVNPGNSGGALVNTAGQLVGINTAILTNSGGYEGFSFAVPSNIVKKIYEDLLEYGAVQRGWLGITIVSVGNGDAIDLKLDEVSGVKIQMIQKNSAAEKAQLRRNDVVKYLNGEAIEDVASFMGKVATYRPGDVIDLDIIRNGSEIKKSVVLLNHLNTTDFVAIRKDKVLKDLGIEIRNLSNEERNRIGLNKALKVVSVLKDSPCDRANLESNYLITKINDTRFNTIQEAIDLIKDSEHESIEFDGRYEGYPGEYSYQIKLPKTSF